MKILGWIRYGDKAACGGLVVEGDPTFKSHGQPLAYYGAHIACRKHCVIAQAHPCFTLPNGLQVPHHGHVTTGGCPLESTLNDVHGWINEGGDVIPEDFQQNSNGKWLSMLAPPAHEDYSHDQHLILEDQDGQVLEGIPYRLIDVRGRITEGTTAVDGKTESVAGNTGETLDCDIAKAPKA